MLLFLVIYSVIVRAVIEIFVILFRLTGLKVKAISYCCLVRKRPF
ncbi:MULTISPECIES: hypothetical protein [Bacillaceae]|nr:MULTISPECIES: hypothetical protein [Bacillaceae]